MDCVHVFRGRAEWPTDARVCQVLMSASYYNTDLGMRTSSSVERQLAVDVPRSVVLVDGHRVFTLPEVLGATRLPRFCTQAVLAPAIEWLMLSSQWFAHEIPGARHPMVVDIRGKTSLMVTKRLGVREWSGESRGTAVLTVSVENDMVLVEWAFTRAPRPACARSAPAGDREGRAQATSVVAVEEWA